MDINEIKPTDRTIDIVHPATGDKLGITVTILSIKDPELKEIKRKMTDERLRLEQRGKTFKAREIESNTNILLFKAMRDWSWEGEATFKGEKPEFNRKNVLEVLEELEWLRDQIDAEVSDEKAFFQG